MNCPACSQLMNQNKWSKEMVIFEHLCSSNHAYLSIISVISEKIVTYNLPFLYNKQIYWFDSNSTRTLIHSQFPNNLIIKINKFIPFQLNYQSQALKLFNLKAFS